MKMICDECRQMFDDEFQFSFCPHGRRISKGVCMTRLATLAAILLVTGCAFLIPIKGSPDSYALSRRVAKEQTARELAAQESKLSDCRIDHPLDANRSPCALIVMRCTQGAGTRKEARGVPVFTTGPDCFPKEAGVCQ